MFLILKVTEISNNQVLAGAVNGQIIVPKLLAKLPLNSTLRLVALDFSGVKVATASFLREAILGFRDLAKRRGLYVVVANANPEVLEDLVEVLLARDEIILHVKSDARGHMTHPHLLGPLDPGLKKVMEALTELGEVDAPTLAKKYPKEGIGPTGWNNRLSTLAGKGVLLESRQGRTKLFRSPLEGNPHGS